MSVCLSVCVFVCVPIYLPVFRCVSMSLSVSMCLCVCLSQSICVSVFLSACLSVCFCGCQSVFRSCDFLSVRRCVSVFAFLLVYVSVFMSFPVFQEFWQVFRSFLAFADFLFVSHFGRLMAIFLATPKNTNSAISPKLKVIGEFCLIFLFRHVRTPLSPDYYAI